MTARFPLFHTNEARPLQQWEVSVIEDPDTAEAWLETFEAGLDAAEAAALALDDEAEFTLENCQ